VWQLPVDVVLEQLQLDHLHRHTLLCIVELVPD
jgi:hypothetical protein